jgi:hypothetical protein
MELFRKCIIFFLLLTLFYELMPEGTYKKHMKLLGGLIFLLLFFQMLFHSERLLPSLSKNYYKRMGTEVFKKKDQRELIEEYQEYTGEQIKEYLTEEGYEVRKTEVEVKEGQITQIEVRLREADQYDRIQVKKKLANVYSVEETHINVES